MPAPTKKASAARGVTLELRRELVLKALMEGCNLGGLLKRFKTWGVSTRTMKRYVHDVLAELAALDSDPDHKRVLKARAAERFNAAYEMAKELGLPAVMAQAEQNQTRLWGLNAASDAPSVNVNVNVALPRTPREWDRRMAELMATDPALLERVKRLQALPAVAEVVATAADQQPAEEGGEQG